jgi:Tfp pilus assembly protein PilP
MTRLLPVFVLVASSVLTGYAQQPAAATTAAATPQPAVEAPAAPPSSAFAYDPAGRRDPFVSLVGRGTAPDAGGVRPAGMPGMLINEVNLKGIMKERSGFVALLQGPDKKTYAVRPGQRLFDGTVKSITQDAVIFSQDVNDPLSVVKQKEVRKTLRSGEESRG